MKAVKIQKLSQQLTKEIKRSPAKAAALGGLLLVALWFWFPLVQGWISTDKPAAPKVAVTETPMPPQPSAPKASQAASAPSGLEANWRDLATRMASDPWMRSGTLRAPTFDPFFPEAPVAEELADSEPAAAKPQADISPESAGLSVSSVIAGSQPLARINSQNYRVGDTVIAGEGMAQYTVTAIESWGVRLVGEHRSYELPLNITPVQSKHRLVLRNGNLISTDN